MLDSQFNINLLRFASIIKFFNINKFASLKKINFQTIERVRFASISKEKIIIEAFASLPFDTIAITVPHFSNSIGAFAVSERVFTTEACAAPGGVYTQGPELQLDVSAQQRYVLLLVMSTSQGPELHLNMSAQQ